MAFAPVPISLPLKDRVHGFDVYKNEKGEVIALLNYGRRLSFHQPNVVSNGRNPLVPKGTKGKLIELAEPNKDGRTDNVVRIDWEGIDYPIWMSFAEFE